MSVLRRVPLPRSRALNPRLAALVFVGAALLCSNPLRHGALAVVRFPFTLLRTGTCVVLLLPRVPALATQQAALRLQLAQREHELAQLREQLRHERQAEALRSAVGSGVVAAILGRSTVPTQHTLLLDRGRAHTIGLEAIVVDAAGVLGRVVDVQPASALVLLITDPDSRIAALVERTRETGLLIGVGTGQCELIYLDVHVDIEPGDRVLTAGLGGPFPKALLLGTVTSVARDEAAGSATATVRPAAALGRAEEVLCLPPAQTAP